MTHTNFTNNTIVNPYYGFYIYDDSNDNWIVNNTIINATSAGISFTLRSDRNTAEGNRIIDSTRPGIRISSQCDNNTIINNNIYNVSQGISVDGTYNNITNNTINKTSGVGISVTGEFSNFDGNQISNPGSVAGVYGIAVSSTNNNFTNNIITNAADSGIYVTAANNTFRNNNLSNNNDCGYEFSGADNNAVYNSTVDNNTVTGACISDSDNNIFSGIHFSNSPIGIRLSGGALNNTLSNLTLVNNPISMEIENSFSTSIENTNFSSYTLFEDTSNGVINFTQNITFGNLVRLSDIMDVASSSIYIDTSTVPGLNKSAVLTFRGLSLSYDPRPTVDFEDDGTFVDCPASVCTEISSTASTFVYNVSHFTNFSIRDVPPGSITDATITIPSTVDPDSTFTTTCSITCVGDRPCENITVTLDPINPLTNLTQPTDYVQSVYADSDFIYAATDNKVGSGGESLVHIWNKTDLSQVTTLSTAGSGLKTVFADSLYIYAGGSDGEIYIWNRTDLTTPFANVFNRSLSGGSAYPSAIVTDNRYIYAGTDDNYVYVLNKTHPTFASVINLTNASSKIRALAVDSNFLYTLPHRDCVVFVYNTTDFTSTSLPLPSNCDYAKDISVDNNSYFYAHGQFSSPYEAFTRVFNKSDYSIVLDWNDSVVQTKLGHAVYAGGPDFAYHGGFDPSYSDGWIGQINKSSWIMDDEKNFADFQIKDLFCDSDYLYAAAQSSTNSDGQVMLFNNSCGVVAAPPSPTTLIAVNSISTVPSKIPLPSSEVYCTANVTTNGTMDTVLFSLTYPTGSSITLNSTNVGDIYNSSSFDVTSAGDHSCLVTANATDGTNTSSSVSFYGGIKGAVPMNSGSPFYTINQNPRYPQNQSCLTSLQPDQTCTTTWEVTANGTLGDTWVFYCAYEGSSLNTSKVDVTIGSSTTPGGFQSCHKNWVCGDWSDCRPDNTQTKRCQETNCGPGTKTENRPCTYVPPKNCGNNICEEDENSDNCCKDCGCLSDYNCVDNLCVEIPKELEELPSVPEVEKPQPSKYFLSPELLDIPGQQELVFEERVLSLEKLNIYYEMFETYLGKWAKENWPTVVDWLKKIEFPREVPGPKYLINSDLLDFELPPEERILDSDMLSIDYEPIETSLGKWAKENWPKLVKWLKEGF
ncbi:right-handed parallel beta-helix repeat-containing protein [Nanoarchaeota archaeon]